jgi:DNA/RNA endonuclease G (NUC1)/PKD repeat protein
MVCGQCPPYILSYYLIEKPQYALSYNNQTKNPNWVSWLIDKSWIGDSTNSVPRSSLKLTNLPPNYPPNTDYSAKSGSEPWMSDPSLSNATFPIKVEGADLNNAVNSGTLDRGHLTAFRDRDRNAKDAISTFLTTNLIPQNTSNNTLNSAWANFEGYLENTLVSEGKKVYIIAGGYYKPNQNRLVVNNTIVDSNSDFVLDSNNRIKTGTPNDLGPGESLSGRTNPKQISVPDFTWKIAVVLDPDQQLADIRSNTQVIAIITPNQQTPTSGGGSVQLPNQPLPIAASKWSYWPYWRVSVNYLEGITGYDFFSNLPDEIQQVIQSDDSSPLITPLQAAPLLASSEIISVSDQSISSSIRGGNNSTIGQSSVVHVPTESSFLLPSTQEVSTNHGGFHSITVSDIGSLKIGFIQNSHTEIGFFHVGIGENSPPQVRTEEESSAKISPLEINFLKTNLFQVDSTQVNPTEISLPSSITLQQLLSSHNPNLQNTTVPTWTEFLQSPTPFNLKIEIQDLPTGQLAEATITGYDTNNRPNAGTLTLDTDGNSLGWFIDTTPDDNTEFDQTLNPTAFRATTGAAAGKYDLLTTILHELGHLNGIIRGNNAFDTHVQNINGIPTFINGTTTAQLTPDGSHLDSTLYPYDLMNTSLKPGVRKLPSALNLSILNAINAGIGNWESGVAGTISAPLTAGALIGINNGDFTTPTTWNTAGATNIINGTATLTEQSQKLSELTQAFIIPQGAKTLQFTIKDNHLIPGDTTKTANDAFEVALLDTNTFNPLAGTSIGLTNTDSLLNIQANGTIHKSDKVTITALGNNSSIVTIDLTQITPTTQATLYFNLLGFGARTSTVTIDDVKLFTDTQPIPVTKNDTLNTNQNTPLTLDPTQLTTNDTNVSQIQIINQPTHGTLTQTTDGKLTYQPIPTYVGNDSFTYLGFGTDGQISNLATVNLTVNNLPPTIETLTIPTTIAEGQNIQLSALAKDGGSSDNLIYTWNLGDGSNPITGQNIAHTYIDNGNYQVTLTVTDKDGGTTNQTTTVKVDNVAPTATITTPNTTLNQGETFNLGVNYSDPGIKDTHTITWNFDDGSNPVTLIPSSSAPQPNLQPHTFTKAGNHNVTVTITDNDGASTTKAIQIAVTNVAPTITNVDIPTNINEGQSVTLTATASDPGNDTLTYNWYLNNATIPITGQTINYAFADNGIYPVKLDVIDSNGAITTQSLNVTVNNIAPEIVAIVKPDKIDEGQPVQFTATATDPGINDTLTYSIL